MQALAAVGLLAGAGAVVVGSSEVVAAWGDRVSGSAEFTAADVAFESLVDGVEPWALHGEDAPAVVNRAAPAMLPGTSVFWPVTLRTTTDSPAVGITVVGAAPQNALGSALRYTVVRSATCTAAAVSGAPPSDVVVGSAAAGVPVATGSAEGVVLLPAGTPTATGTTVPLCFRLTLPDTTAVWADPSLPGSSTTVRWTLDGTAQPNGS